MSVPELTHPSVADIREEDLVDRLLSDVYSRSNYFELHGLPRGMLNKQRVSLNKAPGESKGDIDVLSCAPGRPEEAVAFEVKRIKFGVSALRPGGRPNKLQEFAKAVQQANRLAQLGFWQVYLYVIVVVDAREQNAGRLTYEGLSSELQYLVSSTITLEGLDKRVGLCDLDFTQPMDYAPLTVGTGGLHLHRLSTPALQSAELTTWVKDIFSK